MIARQQTFDEETERLVSSTNQYFLDAMRELSECIRVAIVNIGVASGFPVEAGDELRGGFAFTVGGFSGWITTRDVWANTSRDAKLVVELFKTRLGIRDPAEPKRYAMGFPEPYARIDAELRRLPEIGWAWHVLGQTRTHANAADAILHRLLDDMATAKPRR